MSAKTELLLPQYQLLALNKILFVFSLLRLELDHTLLEYYTELDAVRLYGTKSPPGARPLSPSAPPPGYNDVLLDAPPSYQSVVSERNSQYLK